jgi:hypothetical protein
LPFIPNKDVHQGHLSASCMNFQKTDSPQEKGISPDSARSAILLNRIRCFEKGIALEVAIERSPLRFLPQKLVPPARPARGAQARLTFALHGSRGHHEIFSASGALPCALDSFEERFVDRENARTSSSLTANNPHG